MSQSFVPHVKNASSFLETIQEGETRAYHFYKIRENESIRHILHTELQVSIKQSIYYICHTHELIGVGFMKSLYPFRSPNKSNI